MKLLFSAGSAWTARGGLNVMAHVPDCLGEVTV